MPAAVHLRRQLHARIFPPHVQRAHSLGAIHFVRREAHQVDVVVNHADRNLAHRLRRIRVQQHALLAADLPDFADRLDRADFVVAVHDRHHHGLLRDRVAQLIEVDQSILPHRQIRHAAAVLFEPLARVQNGLVLGRRRNEVVALLRVHLGRALQRQVVRFRGAAGEHDLFRARSNQVRQLLARLLHGFFRRPTETVIAAGRVAEILREVRQHGFEHPWIDARCRVIV